MPGVRSAPHAGNRGTSASEGGGACSEGATVRIPTCPAVANVPIRSDGAAKLFPSPGVGLVAFRHLVQIPRQWNTPTVQKAKAHSLPELPPPPVGRFVTQHLRIVSLNPPRGVESALPPGPPTGVDILFAILKNPRMLNRPWGQKSSASHHSTGEKITSWGYWQDVPMGPLKIPLVDFGLAE